jgi:hypothetical protein
MSALRLTGDRCRCTACGALFTTTRNFDKHRVGKYPERRCAEPSAVGLVLNARGFWSRPGNGRIHYRANATSGDRPSEGSDRRVGTQPAVSEVRG